MLLPKLPFQFDNESKTLIFVSSDKHSENLISGKQACGSNYWNKTLYFYFKRALTTRRKHICLSDKHFENLISGKQTFGSNYRNMTRHLYFKSIIWKYVFT